MRMGSPCGRAPLKNQTPGRAAVSGASFSTVRVPGDEQGRGGNLLFFKRFPNIFLGGAGGVEPAIGKLLNWLT
jgi:hypothetical protein